jgi:yecA family protein
MPTFPNNEPLTDSDLDYLGCFLENCNGGMAMNIEELDGFFAALIAGPETVAPSEYLPEVFGSSASESHQFESLEEANEILGLLIRHWNDIAGTLSRREMHMPVIMEDENGMGLGNDWARGFIRGTRLRPDGWAGLLADNSRGGCMIPTLMLYLRSVLPRPVRREHPVPQLHGLGDALVFGPGLARYALGWPPGGQNAHRLLSATRIQCLRDLLDDESRRRSDG